jgi:2-amino-4-hydroxy-6-hydroxymethyldihydropteridine diphosphokinase
VGNSLAPILIALGANLAEPQQQLDDAVRRLQACPSCQLKQVSSVYVTAPAGGPQRQNDFLNAALTAETTLSPAEVLGELHRIEDAGGRHRGSSRDRRWAPRTIDLDLILYGDHIIGNHGIGNHGIGNHGSDLPHRDSELIVPHPRAAWRRFVLQPAAEIAANWIHPLLNASLSDLLHRMEEHSVLGLYSESDSDVEAVQQAVQGACTAEVRAYSAIRPFDAAAGQLRMMVAIDGSAALLRDFWQQGLPAIAAPRDTAADELLAAISAAAIPSRILPWTAA